jgi:hypothetical protein
MAVTLNGHTANDVVALDVFLLLTDLVAGTYTLRPQWRTETNNTAKLFADAADTPLIFEAIEI